ncbi:universal stress protein [Corynebacterium resistens]
MISSNGESESHHAAPKAPLRVLMAWRPQSTSDEAAEVAAWVGRTEEIRVRAATVIPRAWEIQPGAQEFQEYRNWVMAETQACMNAALSALGKAGLPQGMLAEEDPAVVDIAPTETKVLIKAAEDFEADFLLLGSHPAAPRSRFRMGSTADALLHCAPLPVLLAPRSPKLAKNGVTRVSCSYVDTVQSHEALRRASDLAARWNVPLRLVAFSPSGATMYPTNVPFDDNSDMMVEWREQALALLDRGRDRALSRHPNLKVQLDVGSGYGWSGAINALKWKKGDLLVMGSSELGQFNRVFIGPSTNQILRHSPVPVLVSPV